MGSHFFGKLPEVVTTWGKMQGYSFTDLPHATDPGGGGGSNGFRFRG